MVHQKMIRAKSLLEATKFGAEGPNFESLEDTLKDAINYLSFGVAWLRYKMDGQTIERDIFNRPMSKEMKEAGTWEEVKKESEK